MQPWISNVYLRALLYASLEWIPNSTFHGACFCFLYKLIINLFMHICPRSSTAALSLQNFHTIEKIFYKFKQKTALDQWPVRAGDTWLKNRAKCASSTAWSTSASSQTIKGDLPPSSRVTGLRLLLADNSRTILPVSVEPVKASCRYQKWVT